MTLPPPLQPSLILMVNEGCGQSEVKFGVNHPQGVNHTILNIWEGAKVLTSFRTHPPFTIRMREWWWGARSDWE
jgi:hypothetical protein